MAAPPTAAPTAPPTAVPTSLPVGGVPPSDAAKKVPFTRDELQEDLAIFQEHLNNLVESSRRVCRTGSMVESNNFAEELSSFEFDRSGKDPLLVKMGMALKEVEGFRATLMEQIDSIVTIPMEQFNRAELQRASDLRRRLEKARDAYDAAQLKFDIVRSSSKKGVEKASKFESELAEAKRTYDTLLAEHTAALIDISSRKKFELTERLCTLMFAQLSFYRQAYTRLKSLEPELRTAMAAAESERQAYAAGAAARHDLSQLSSQFNDITNSEKQGYLEIKKASGGLWKRRWVVVTEGTLHLYRSWKDAGSPQRSLPLLLCSVKISPVPDRPHAFALLSPPDVHYCFSAYAAADLRDWVDVIQRQIAAQLKHQPPTNRTPANFKENQGTHPTTNTSSFSASPSAPSLASDASPFEQLRALSPANRVCADCAAAAPPPDWVSVNLGVVLCADCAGVHRLLSVAVSRVRSLNLDRWEPETLTVVKALGNERANQIWEAKLRPEEKIVATTDRNTRERFIRAKYVDKQWIDVAALPRDPPGAMPQRLLDAIRRNDLPAVYAAIAAGADVNWANPKDSLKAVLHYAVVDNAVSLATLELLIQSGCHVYGVDSKGWTPLHYAALADRVGAARLLVTRGADTDAADADGKTPLDIARIQQSRRVEALLLASAAGREIPPELEAEEPSVLAVTPSGTAAASLSSELLAPSGQNKSPEATSGPQKGGASSVEGDAERLAKVKDMVYDAIAAVGLRVEWLRSELHTKPTMEKAIEIAKRARMIKMTLFGQRTSNAPQPKTAETAA